MANLKDLIVNGSARILGTIYGNLTGNVTGRASVADKLKITGDYTGSTASTFYPVWANGTTGDRNCYVTTSKLKFDSYNGILTTKVVNSNYQQLVHLGNTGTIALDSAHQIYFIKPTADQTISLNLTNIDPMSTTGGQSPATVPYVYTFELIIDLTGGAHTISFPAHGVQQSDGFTYVYEDGNQPTPNGSYLYMYVFRRFGTEYFWYISQQGVWLD